MLHSETNRARTTSYAFYGNAKGDEVLVIDVDQMVGVAAISTGQGPYPVDRVTDDVLLAITRKSKSVDKIDARTLQNVGLVALPHTPRTAKSNRRTAVLVSGADRPQTTVLDYPTLRVVRSVGDSTPGQGSDFGGKNASGHETWLSDGQRFFLLDRVHRSLAVYDSATGNQLWQVETPTSAHHVLVHPTDPDRYLIPCEGSPTEAIPPSVLDVEATAGSYGVLQNVPLPVDPGDYAAMGGHHIDARPDGRELYMGSAEGYTYVLDSGSLEVIAKVRTGLGCGHTAFVELEGSPLAVAINHNDTDVTLIDPASHGVVGSIRVANAPPTGSAKSQGHTSGFVASTGRFYMVVPHEARFLEIDLAARSIVRELDLAAAFPSIGPIEPLQGSFVWSEGGRTCTNCV